MVLQMGSKLMDNSVLLSCEYIVVIDTDKPSFEFANDLVAYCTGYEHEKSTDDSFAKKFLDEVVGKDDDNLKSRLQSNPFYGFVYDKMDQEGFYTPCSVWLNKNFGCSNSGEYARLTKENCDSFMMPAPLSVGIFFENEPTEQHYELLKERAIKFFKHHLKENVRFEGIRLITQTRYGSEKIIY